MKNEIKKDQSKKMKLFMELKLSGKTSKAIKGGAVYLDTMIVHDLDTH